MMEVLFKKRFEQKVDFSGLRFDTKLPTDVDAFLDFGNRLFVFIEYKFEEKKLPFGQRLALERLVKSSRVPAVALVANHTAKSSEYIPAGKCFVSEYCTNEGWNIVREKITDRDFITCLLKKI